LRRESYKLTKRSSSKEVHGHALEKKKGSNRLSCRWFVKDPFGGKIEIVENAEKRVKTTGGFTTHA